MSLHGAGTALIERWRPETHIILMCKHYFSSCSDRQRMDGAQPFQANLMRRTKLSRHALQ
jgi:hypothetical protein